MRTWQERHKPLPAHRCEVKGCLEPARFSVVDHWERPHLACDGHLNWVAAPLMRPNDCLAVA